MQEPRNLDTWFLTLDTKIKKMKNFKGFLLLNIAVALIIPLTIINRRQVRKDKGDTNGYYRSTALNIDVWANREFRATWNAKLRTENGYQFGKVDETISSALGKNQRDETLSKTGKKLANFLDWLDENHCKKAIRD